MLYTPVPGTPLHAEHQKAGTLLSEDEFPPADAHGQYRFSYRHAHIKAGQEEGFLLRAFKQDFRENGPSLSRLIRTLLTGWQRYKGHSEARVRERYAREVAPLRSTYAGAVWAMKQYYRDTPPMFERMRRLLADICREFGWRTRLAAPFIGLYAYVQLLKEERRLARGWRYEPRTFYEKNPAAEALEAGRQPTPAPRPGHAGSSLIPPEPEPVLKQ
jgi:hypothetical protein